MTGSGQGAELLPAAPDPPLHPLGHRGGMKKTGFAAGHLDEGDKAHGQVEMPGNLAGLFFKMVEIGRLGLVQADQDTDGATQVQVGALDVNEPGLESDPSVDGAVDLDRTGQRLELFTADRFKAGQGDCQAVMVAGDKMALDAFSQVH